MDKHPLHTGVYWAIAGSLVVTLLGTYLIVQNQQVEQVGGRENYKTYQKMVKNPKYGDNIKQSLDAQIAQMEGGETDTPPAANTPPAAEPKETGMLTQDEIAAVTNGAYIKWNKDADILWVEYSDLECPFCKRLHDSGAISNLQGKYGDKLAVSFKHYTLPFHTQAIPGALAAECVGEAGGSDKYFAFIEGVFKKGTPTQENIDAVVKDLWLDDAKIKTCVDSNKFKSVVDAHMAEGSGKFGVNGTPGNVLINTKTGAYEVVSGAQPEANFQAAIDRLMK